MTSCAVRLTLWGSKSAVQTHFVSKSLSANKLFDGLKTIPYVGDRKKLVSAIMINTRGSPLEYTELKYGCEFHKHEVEKNTTIKVWLSGVDYTNEGSPCDVAVCCAEIDEIIERLIVRQVDSRPQDAIPGDHTMVRMNLIDDKTHQFFFAKQLTVKELLKDTSIRFPGDHDKKIHIITVNMTGKISDLIGNKKFLNRFLSPVAFSPVSSPSIQIWVEGVDYAKCGHPPAIKTSAGDAAIIGVRLANRWNSDPKVEKNFKDAMDGTVSQEEKSTGFVGGTMLRLVVHNEIPQHAYMLCKPKKTSELFEDLDIQMKDGIVSRIEVTLNGDLDDYKECQFTKAHGTCTPNTMRIWLEGDTASTAKIRQIKSGDAIMIAARLLEGARIYTLPDGNYQATVLRFVLLGETPKQTYLLCKPMKVNEIFKDLSVLKPDVPEIHHIEVTIAGDPKDYPSCKFVDTPVDSVCPVNTFRTCIDLHDESFARIDKISPEDAKKLISQLLDEAIDYCDYVKNQDPKIHVIIINDVSVSEEFKEELQKEMEKNPNMRISEIINFQLTQYKKKAEQQAKQQDKSAN